MSSAGPEPPRRRYVIVSRPRRAADKRPSQPAPRPEVEPPVDLEALAQRLYGRSRRDLVAEAAYLRSQSRVPGRGDSHADWLEAEAQLDLLLRRSQTD